MTTGVLARGTLIASLYKRGVYLTGKARLSVPNAALINHVSNDSNVSVGVIQSDGLVDLN